VTSAPYVLGFRAAEDLERYGGRGVARDEQRFRDLRSGGSPASALDRVSGRLRATSNAKIRSYSVQVMTRMRHRSAAALASEATRHDDAGPDGARDALIGQCETLDGDDCRLDSHRVCALRQLAFASSSSFRKVASFASDTSTHFLSGAASAS
jgi:hypothetical protein